MGLRDTFRQMREDIVKGTQESIERTKETSKWRTVFLEEKLPQGIQSWRPGAGQHIVDIIPFLAGVNHPRTEKGRITFLVDYYVHRNIGPLGDNWVCKLKTTKKSDPICEYIRRVRPEKTEWKRIKPTRMTAYLVWVHDTPEEEKKGLQLWDVAHFLFQEPVDAQAKHPKGGAPFAYADIDSGKSVYFEIVKSGKWTDDRGKERDSVKYQGHKFIDREGPLPDEIVDASFSLDECMDLNPSDELMNASFYGEATGDASGEEAKETPPETPDEFRREPVGSGQQQQACNPTPPVPPPSSAPPPKPDFRDFVPGSPEWKEHWKAYREDQPAMLQFQESLRAPEPPKAPAQPAPAAPAPAAGTASGECPSGHVFGADNEKKPECRKCPVWDACAEFLDSGGASSSQAPAASPPQQPAPSTGSGLRRRL